MEEYFDRNKEKLRQVFERFRNTTYGKKLNLPLNFKDYGEFVKLPLLDPEKVDLQQLNIPGEGLRQFTTSGVSGHKKTVYRDIGTIVSYPREMDETLRNNKTLFLHSKRRENESYYETHDFNHKRMYPQGIFREYGNIEELLKYVQEGNVLFIVEYPLMTEWFCYQLENALENSKILPKNIRKRKVYLELSGEPVTRSQVENIVERLKKIFQTEVDYVVTYGSNEIGHIGTYTPTIHGSEIIYETIPSVFVEEINNEIIITPFRTEGTILLRYKTGDKGAIIFKGDRGPFLKVLGKNPEEGILYVAGAQVNIAELASILRSLLKSPVGLVVNKDEDERAGRCNLNINLHTVFPIDDSTRNKVSLFIKKFIMDSAVLEIENHLGITNLEITYSNEPLKKQFIIYKKGGK